MSTGTPTAPASPIRLRKVTPLEPVPQTATLPPAGGDFARTGRASLSSSPAICVA